MKKKGLSNLMTVMLIVLLVFITIGSVLAVVIGLYDSLRKPHFKITKEGCENTTTPIRELSGGGCNVGCLYYRKIINGSWDDSKECLKFCESNLTYRETCEHVEVEEIDGTTVFCLEADKSMNMKYCHDNFRNKIFFKLSKKDLTISWLDENCECIEGGKDDMTIPCEDLSCSNRVCSKYKCQDYMVETWSQLK